MPDKHAAQDLLRKAQSGEDLARWSQCLARLVKHAAPMCPAAMRAAYPEVCTRLMVSVLRQIARGAAIQTWGPAQAAEASSGAYWLAAVSDSTDGEMFCVRPLHFLVGSFVRPSLSAVQAGAGQPDLWLHDCNSRSGALGKLPADSGYTSAPAAKGGEV